MASSVRLKPLNCSRLPCVYEQETLTFLLTQKKTCVNNFFFFSSRRRHTRLVSDWSSDVCSSDLRDSRGDNLRETPQTAARIPADTAGRIPFFRQHARSEERRVGKECRSRWSW